MALNYFPIFLADSSVTSGNPGKTGLTPTWTVLKTIGATPGTDVSSHAAVTEIGGGVYQIAYDAELYGDTAGVLDAGSALAANTDRYVPVTMVRDSGRVLGALDATGHVVLGATGWDAVLIETNYSAKDAAKVTLAAALATITGNGTANVTVATLPTPTRGTTGQGTQILATMSGTLYIDRGTTAVRLSNV